MRIGGAADYVAHVKSAKELETVYQHYKQKGVPMYVVGGGSNLIAHDDGFRGVIIKNEIMGITILENNPTYAKIQSGAGESWDGFVKFTVDLGLSGVEALSGIPGTVGAGSVQNIGAYGQEIADTMVSLEAYDTHSDSFVTLTSEDCEFSYRHSIFRGRAAGRYIITAVIFTLNKTPPEPPYYDSLQKYLDTHNVDIGTVSVQTIRDAVLQVRSSKLPDPAKLPNAGSFFKNAIVEKWRADDLRRTFADMPTYPVDDKHVKIPAGWLVEAAGLKGEVLHGIKVHDEHADVLINQSATSYADLASARQEIIQAVKSKFDIVLEQEPLELSAVS